VNAPIKRTSTLAIISLVSGLLGWTLVPFLGSVAAIITGHMARAEIRREAETTEGDGLAIAGLVLGWGMVAMTVLVVAMIFLFFGGLALFLGWMGATGNLN
jgi:hypothetical protein